MLAAFFEQLIGFFHRFASFSPWKDSHGASIVSAFIHCKGQILRLISRTMSWKLKQNLRARLEREKGAVPKDWGGKVSVALVYPNVYTIGMGNLAVHAIYKMLNDRRDVVCERVFLPEKAAMREHLRTDTPLMSVESQRPLAEFDIIAFSISFENDYLNIKPMLGLAKIPYKVSDRRKDAPVLIAGGAAPTLNPLPISKIFDAVVSGEIEAYSDDLIPLIASKTSKSEMLEALSKISGGCRFSTDLDSWPVQTVIHSAEAEFGNMHLIEVQRGCSRRCSFCATPIIYGRPRSRSAAAVIEMVKTGIGERKKFGLIGSHILSHPEFVAIANGIHELGAVFSPSSVHVDDIDDEKALLLAKSGHRSVALGIEAGNYQLRKKLGKNIDDARIFEAVKILAQHEITRLKLYFMIGLPFETDDDVADIAKLANMVQDAIFKNAPKLQRTTKLDLTITPFVPKPGTLLGDSNFAGVIRLKQKIKLIKKLLGNKRGIGLNFDNPSDAEIEAILANGGEDAISLV